jgi:hypothetical protein
MDSDLSAVVWLWSTHVICLYLFLVNFYFRISWADHHILYFVFLLIWWHHN